VLGGAARLDALVLITPTEQLRRIRQPYQASQAQDKDSKLPLLLKLLLWVQEQLSHQIVCPRVDSLVTGDLEIAAVDATPPDLPSFVHAADEEMLG
jgi:hypothetical protein